jgi:hypothetical protein
MSLERTNIRQVLEYLVDERAPAIEPRSFSDLFDRLIWLASDNGKGLLQVMSIWVESDDYYRVKVALGLEEAFLFDSRAAMVDAFERLEKRWPEVKDRCNEILESWDKSVPPAASER